MKWCEYFKMETFFIPELSNSNSIQFQSSYLKIIALRFQYLGLHSFGEMWVCLFVCMRLKFGRCLCFWGDFQGLCDMHINWHQTFDHEILNMPVLFCFWGGPHLQYDCCSETETCNTAKWNGWRYLGISWPYNTGDQTEIPDWALFLWYSCYVLPFFFLFNCFKRLL